MEIITRNTNLLSPIAYNCLKLYGRKANSRNGPVLRLMEPLTICLTSPWERVNFCPKRDANPFFHLIEACAMLVDLNSAPFLSHFAANMANYSDDRLTYNSFYGTRLRTTWGDQLNDIVNNLLRDPESRQEVALIWHPKDLTAVTKDKACNLMLIFSVNPETEALEMTSLNRSNDAIFGMVSGANIVHLSIFQEYVACALGRRMGRWFHFSNNFHVYLANPKWELVRDEHPKDFYSHQAGGYHAVPLFPIGCKPQFLLELTKLVNTMDYAARNNTFVNTGFYLLPFVKDVAVMFNVWQMHKTKQSNLASMREVLQLVQADDWREAADLWLQRRY
jgi:hypothetical protein